eukprot:4160913-Amphidinium_carterae.1
MLNKQPIPDWAWTCSVRMWEPKPPSFVCVCARSPIWSLEALQDLLWLFLALRLSASEQDAMLARQQYPYEGVLALWLVWVVFNVVPATTHACSIHGQDTCVNE